MSRERPTWWPEKPDGLPTGDLVVSVYDQIFALTQGLVCTDLSLREYCRREEELYRQISAGFVNITWEDLKKYFYNTPFYRWVQTAVHEGDHALVTAHLLQEMQLPIEKVKFGFGMIFSTKNGEINNTPMFLPGDLYSLVRWDKKKYIDIYKLMLLGSVHPSTGDMNMMHSLDFSDDGKWVHPGIEVAQKSLAGELLLPEGAQNVLKDLRDVPLDRINTDIFGGLPGLSEYIGISLPGKIARIEAPYIACQIILNRLNEIGFDITSEDLKKFIRTLINDSYWGITSVDELWTYFTKVTGIKWDEKVQKAFSLLYAVWLIPFSKQDPSAPPYMRQRPVY